jgi:GTPase SAR1 family protein
MNKLDQLSQAFSKGANVVIFCSENDRREIFEELAKTTPKENYGVFKNDNKKLKTSSAMVNGKTFHFISEQQLDKLIVDLEKIEI